MIVRMWEVRLVPGTTEEFCAFLVAVRWPVLLGYEGFLGGSVFRSYDGEGDERVVVLTRWADEPALQAWAGPQWRVQSVTLDGEEPFLARPAHVWHFVEVDLPVA